MENLHMQFLVKISLPMSQIHQTQLERTSFDLLIQKATQASILLLMI